MLSSKSSSVIVSVADDELAVIDLKETAEVKSYEMALFSLSTEEGVYDVQDPSDD